MHGIAHISGLGDTLGTLNGKFGGHVSGQIMQKVKLILSHCDDYPVYNTIN